MYPSDKKDDDFNFKRVLQCFLPLAMYPFGLKGCKKINFLINVPFGHFSLAIYPSDHFFLKALFLRGPPAGSAPLQLKGISIRVLGPLGLDSELLGPPGLDSCLRWPPGLHFGRLGHPVPIFVPQGLLGSILASQGLLGSRAPWGLLGPSFLLTF